MTPRKPLTQWQIDATPDYLPFHVRRNIELGPDGCWLWARSCSPDGYGWVSVGNRTMQAHRLVYFAVKGEVAPGLVIDHLCRVRHCVNPDHMEPVTPAENLRRSPITPAGMTRCLTCGGELVHYRNQRRCVPCGRVRAREYARQQRRSQKREVAA